MSSQVLMPFSVFSAFLRFPAGWGRSVICQPSFLRLGNALGPSADAGSEFEGTRPMKVRESQSLPASNNSESTLAVPNETKTLLEAYTAALAHLYLVAHSQKVRPPRKQLPTARELSGVAASVSPLAAAAFVLAQERVAKKGAAFLR